MAETTKTANTTIVTSMLSSVLPPIVEKAASLALDQCEICLNINREIMYLKSTLNEVNEILEEAEERQTDNITVRGLLRDLVDIGYEARDELDDFITSASVISTRGTSRSVIMLDCLPISFFLRCFDNSWSSGVQVVLLQYRVAWNIKSIRNRLGDIMKQRDIVNISKYVSDRKGSGSYSARRSRQETSCYVNRQRNLFVGRKDEKDKIIKKLVNHNGKDVVVVPIRGVGGVGKTTLAQSVYNDEALKEDYPISNRHWLFVGEKEFNAKEIIARIIGESNTPGIAAIQRKLVENFNGDKFLIVLDDVWKLDSNEWNLLFDPLTNVGKGGLIIITTRIREVISATNTKVQNHLRPLSYEDCWKIFQSHAFADGKSSDRPELELVGQEIVKKLDGLPLAAQVVGSSLLNEPHKTWSDFIMFWERNLRNNDNKIMAALRWSYKLLPPRLKHCFAYCALFPKDHVFDRKVLVEMWMAHDLIQNVDGRPEDVGAQYFKDLVYASLFQYVDKRYVMHDMIHDLARLVSNEEFSGAIGSLTIDQMEKVRHITIINDNEYSKNLSLCKSKRILTVYTPYKEYLIGKTPLEKDILLDVLKQSKSLRVLVLSNKHIAEIPECISELKHLRYLDVTNTSVKSLPNSLCQLHNLQMLAAPLRAVLPRDIVNIRSLRYVRANLSTCQGVGKLTSLQELSSVGVCEGDNIRELGVMRQLRGKLKVNGLENISSSEDAAQALMQDKEYLEELELEFCSRDLGKSSIETDVLEALGFPPNLKRLTIAGYTGVKTPRWMVDGKLVANLQTLELSKCHQMEFLQLPLGEMRSLKDLRIANCSKIKVMDFSCLPSLRGLVVLSGCDELISISGKVAVKYLTILKCEKLESVSTNFNIEHLRIVKCPSLERFTPSSSSSALLLSSSPRSRLRSLTTDNEQIFRNIFEQDLTSNIRDITIIENSTLVECLGEIMKNSSHNKLKSIGSLTINRCNQLQSLPTSCLPHSLKSFGIFNCPQLQSLPTGCLPHSLESLIIFHCPQLQSLPTDCLPHSLEYLLLSNCPQLQSLPVDGLPPSIRRLRIKGCPLLYESDFVWDKIKYIRSRGIDA